MLVQWSDCHRRTMSKKSKEAEKQHEEERDQQQEHLTAVALAVQRYREQQSTSRRPSSHQVHLSSSEMGRTMSAGSSLAPVDPSTIGRLAHLSSHETHLQRGDSILPSRELQKKPAAPSASSLLALYQQQQESMLHRKPQAAPIARSLTRSLRPDNEEDARQRKPQAVDKSGIATLPRGSIHQSSNPQSVVSRSSSTVASRTPVAYGDLTQYRALMEKELSAIPAAKKQAYTQALATCPAEVREKEAHLDWFLRREELNCRAAAERLVKYWQNRLDTFDTKAFLPLQQTGEGALERKELTVLGTGFLNLLPTDSNGNPVLSIDIFRLKKSSTIDSIRRCIFYMFVLLAESEASRLPGATLLIMLNGSSLDKINIGFFERLCDSLPIRFKAVHLLSYESVPPNIVSKIQFGCEVFLHVAASKTELIQKLEPFGLQQSGLPKRFGGEWGFDKYVHWQELRTRMEWKIPFGLSGRGAEGSSTNREFPGIVPYTHLSDEEKIERKRRMNVIHSRRKRDRERVEIDLLQEQIEELQEKKVKLSQENQWLENLSRSANADLLSMQDANSGVRPYPVGPAGQSWQDFSSQGVPGPNHVFRLQQHQQQFPLNQFNLSGQNDPSIMGPSLFSTGQVQRGQAASDSTRAALGNVAPSESSSSSPTKPLSLAPVASAPSLMRQLEGLLNPVEFALLQATLLGQANSQHGGTSLSAVGGLLQPPQVAGFPFNSNNLVSSLLMQSATHRSEERKSPINEDDQEKKANSP